jgi:hypothetical protein
LSGEDSQESIRRTIFNRFIFNKRDMDDMECLRSNKSKHWQRSLVNMI